ncbi:MAG: hypothetical protein Q9195_003591 [Heterodermia aff. obscurata]
MAIAHLAEARYIMYLTGFVSSQYLSYLLPLNFPRQHNVVPEKSKVSDLTHVALAFMRPNIFNQPEPHSWPMFTTVEKARSQFWPGTAIMVAIGGWGDTHGFEVAARTERSRELFAENVRRMVEDTGADGVDIDWEYPGGNGEDYKLHPNPTKAWQIPAYPLLLSTLRRALGPSKLISAAVPGLPRDMLAFTPLTTPSIHPSLNFLNIMTYDLMNRRSNTTSHHTGLAASRTAINGYLALGIPPHKLNLGFAFYVKWFRTSPLHTALCSRNPIGCPTALLEDPATGADLGRAGGFSYHDPVPAGEVGASWARARAYGAYDVVGGGQYYWDGEAELWWSWDTPEAMGRKFAGIMAGNAKGEGLGGVFAWGLGEDAEAFGHLEALSREVRGWRGGSAVDEL